MVANAPKINPTIALFKQVMVGIDSRHRTNIATLLAGAFVALHRRIPSLEEAQAMAAEFKGTVELHALALDRDDAVECLEMLLSHVVEKYPLGQWLAAELAASSARNPIVHRDSLRILAGFGIKVVPGGNQPGFFIMNGAPAVEKIFATTKWASRAWERALRKLPASFTPNIPVYFSAVGRKSRCLGLPLSMIPESSDIPPPLEFNA